MCLDHLPALKPRFKSSSASQCRKAVNEHETPRPCRSPPLLPHAAIAPTVCRRAPRAFCTGCEQVPRILTYNVHSCFDMDGGLSPQRIAKVIAPCQPDIVCLQELDVGRVRTRGIDQACTPEEEVRVRHILVASEALAQDLRARITGP